MIQKPFWKQTYFLKGGKKQENIMSSYVLLLNELTCFCYKFSAFNTNVDFVTIYGVFYAYFF